MMGSKYNSIYNNPTSNVPSAGGGFVYPSAANSQSQLQQQPSKQNVEKLLRPVTCRQIILAVHDQVASVFKVDNIELSQLSLVGRISSVTKSSTNTKFELDDSTGTIEVTKWVDKDAELESVEVEDDLVEGDYVLVYGHLRDYHGKKSIGSYKIVTITDPNIITHHYLEVVKVHLEFTRGRPNQDSTNRPSHVLQPTNNASYMQPNNGNGGGGNRLEDSIRSYMDQYRNLSEGVHLDVIVSAFRSIANEDEVRNQIQMLTDEGFLYTTSDDWHFALS